MKKTFFLAILICLGLTSFAQNAEEEKIKKVIYAETESFFSRNLNAWRATWAQNPKMSRSIISNNYHSYEMGWDSANVQMERFIKNNSTPEAVKVENKNYNIVQQGNMAWVHYDQWLKNSAGTGPESNYSKEYRVLVKEKDDWKIIAQVTTFPESFDHTKPASMENNLNATGYGMLQAKKTAEAIEIFKLAVKLFPDSWNLYDSLAEAYVMAGDTKMAVENYEKSIKINPGNEHGVRALAKLKMQ